MATYDLSRAELKSKLTEFDADTRDSILKALRDSFGNGPYHVQLYDDPNVTATADGNTQAILVNTQEDVNLTVNGDNNVVIGTGFGNDTINVNGDGADTVFSGAGDDTIHHFGSGPSVLDGGAGKDILNGGAGKDSFIFSTALLRTNVDRVGDFNHAQDTIRLDNAVFTGLSGGALPPSAFVLGTRATDPEDRIIYNRATGNLYFDADGADGAAAVRFAVIVNKAALDASDFFVV